MNQTVDRKRVLNLTSIQRAKRNREELRNKFIQTVRQEELELLQQEEYEYDQRRAKRLSNIEDNK